MTVVSETPEQRLCVSGLGEQFKRLGEKLIRDL